MDYQDYYNSQLHQDGGKIDYKNYYHNQLKGSGLPVFAGYPNQRGYGLGGVFRQLFNWFVPLIKTHALPLLKKGGEVVGTEVLKSATNVATDVLSGRNIKDSAKENFTNTLNTLSEKVAESTNQKGRGYKRGKKSKYNSFKLKKFRYRRLIDVFDK